MLFAFLSFPSVYYKLEFYPPAQLVVSTNTFLAITLSPKLILTISSFHDNK